MATSVGKLDSRPIRISLWSTSRSLSTAFARSMSARGDTEVFWEPYFSCYFFGPDGAERRRLLPFVDSSMTNDKYTFSHVSEVLNAKYPGAKVLFVKDMVEGIRDNFDIVDRSYKHCFLIRHPRKTFTSLYRNAMSAQAENSSRDPYNMISRHTDMYHVLEKFYQFVQTKLGQMDPPIIDADDLVTRPDDILRKYCQRIGIDFTPKMLEWEPIYDVKQLKWHCTDVGVFKHPQVNQSLILLNSMKGQGFGQAPNLTKHIELPSEVENMISYATQTYEKLYNLRIRP